jgi:Holliday junction DNA helicase RuvA
MIGKLTGVILEKNPPEILLEVNGIGYEILCPMSSFYAFGEDKNLALYTHLQVKEDAQTLYGFYTKDEKTLFRELIRVNGVGPKVALAILSHLDGESLLNAVANEDDALLACTPGIGKKTAQKLIVELKDRLEKLTLTTKNHQKTNSENSNKNKALQTLQALGFKPKEAEKMLGTKIDNTLTTEALVRIALKNK